MGLGRIGRRPDAPHHAVLRSRSARAGDRSAPERRLAWRRVPDVISGTIGAAVYALERLPDPGAAECLERIVERLSRSAESSGRFTTWRSPRSRRIHPYPEGLNRRRYAIGVAHGVAGIVAALASIHAAGIARRQTRRLVEGAVRWLLDCRDSAPGSCFPREIDSRGRAVPARNLGWCWGDSGTIAALFVAAASLDRDDWRREALAAARVAAAVHPLDAGIVDGGLCHGTAGVAHLFNRMYQQTGDLELREAARFWFRQTLRIRRPGRGIGGYFAVWPTRTRIDGAATHWRDVRAPGFLGGSAGIALALWSASEAVEPLWDRALLVS